MDTPPAPAPGAIAATPEAVPAVSAKAADRGVFLEGSLMRHILVMTSSTAVGLAAIFLSDFINLVFLGRLQDPDIPAAIGYAASILFFTVSVGIGLSIAAAALVAPAIGAGDRAHAVRLSGNVYGFTLLVTIGMVTLLMPLLPQLLRGLGASGRVLDLATTYLAIITLSSPLLALGIAGGAVLRSLGDARLSMATTLSAAGVNVVLDAIFILGFGWGLTGAALATALSRVALVGVALWALRRHGFWPRFSLAGIGADLRPILAIAVPAIATNIATPIANAYVTAATADFGDAAVGAWAAINRLLPVALAFVFALSGSIGPILGQNWGAGLMPRVRETARLSLLVTACYMIVAWGVLALLHPAIADAFGLIGEARALLAAFCLWQMPIYLFTAIVFVCGAAFNNLGRPNYSTALNWGRATVGTVPFVMAGAAWGGAEGAIAGSFAGAAPFALIAVPLLFRHIHTLQPAPQRR